MHQGGQAQGFRYSGPVDFWKVVRTVCFESLNAETQKVAHKQSGALILMLTSNIELNALTPIPCIEKGALGIQGSISF